MTTHVLIRSTSKHVKVSTHPRSRELMDRNLSSIQYTYSLTQSPLLCLPISYHAMIPLLYLTYVRNYLCHAHLLVYGCLNDLYHIHIHIPYHIASYHIIKIHHKIHLQSPYQPASQPADTYICMRTHMRITWVDMQRCTFGNEIWSAL